jgi:hypothetical protein
VLKYYLIKEGIKMFDEIFGSNSTDVMKDSGTKILSKTNELNAISKAITANFMNSIKQSTEENLKEKVDASIVDNAALHELIMEHGVQCDNDGFVDVVDEWKAKIGEIDKEEILKMIRSQSSSKSHLRAKLTKEMTFDKYASFIKASVGELVIREVSGRRKVERAAPAILSSSLTVEQFIDRKLLNLSKDEKDEFLEEVANYVEELKQVN